MYLCWIWTVALDSMDLGPDPALRFNGRGLLQRRNFESEPSTAKKRTG